MDDPTEKDINYWLPTGVGLLGIGVLTLATPLFTTLSQKELFIDMITGTVMTLAGLVSVMIGYKP